MFRLVPLVLARVVWASGGHDAVKPQPRVHSRETRRPIAAAAQTVSIEDRFASVVPEFAGAYRGPENTLIVRVTDPGLSREGGPDPARVLLERELAAFGRSELKVTFEPAKYSYLQLQSWIKGLLDSLGAYGAASWYVEQRTSRIHVGVLDAQSQRSILAAAVKIGIPKDAIFTERESGARIRPASAPRGMLDRLPRPS